MASNLIFSDSSSSESQSSSDSEEEDLAEYLHEYEASKPRQVFSWYFKQFKT